VAETIKLAPESVTIYQMELPYNTVFSREIKELKVIEAPSSSSLPGVGGSEGASRLVASIADWPTKRAWVNYAFDELLQAGYEISSAYTLVRDRKKVKFVYRDGLWHGADMFGTGVASFGHVNGVHVQNLDRWEDWLAALEQDRLPLNRALPVTPRQLLIREMILQLKTGRLEVGYFRDKFGVEILDEFALGFQTLASSGFLTCEADRVELTRPGYLQIDRLLPTFFEPEFQGARYT
jgi:oxygen-independent coproporphyrinogen-3 oxidase